MDTPSNYIRLRSVPQTNIDPVEKYPFYPCVDEHKPQALAFGPVCISTFVTSGCSWCR